MALLKVPANNGNVAHFLAAPDGFGKTAFGYATFVGQDRLGSMESAAELRADCARCQGLCCVSLAFYRSEWFAFDKPADEPCPHLSPSNRCRQHARLDAAGQGGCASYDCYGAGQRVTEELLPGVGWRAAPEQRRALSAAFFRLRDVHELRLLLREAARLALPDAAHAEGQLLLGQLEPARGFSAAELAALDVRALHSAVHAYLRGLRPHVRAERRRLPVLA